VCVDHILAHTIHGRIRHSPLRPIRSKHHGNKTHSIEYPIESAQRKYFTHVLEGYGRSQWPRGLRHEPSSTARTLGSWVRISLKLWVPLCVYSVPVLFCVELVALRRADPQTKGSYRLCTRLRNLRCGRNTKSCRGTERERERKERLGSYSVRFVVGTHAILLCY
jgi:hypothetical protein